jgi:hypothetical protein
VLMKTVQKTKTVLAFGFLNTIWAIGTSAMAVPLSA